MIRGEVAHSFLLKTGEYSHRENPMSTIISTTRGNVKLVPPGPGLTHPLCIQVPSVHVFLAYSCCQCASALLHPCSWCTPASRAPYFLVQPCSQHTPILSVFLLSEHTFLVYPWCVPGVPLFPVCLCSVASPFLVNPSYQTSEPLSFQPLLSF